MSQILGTELPDRAVRYLQVGRVVTVATVDADGAPDTAPISWLLAPNPRIVRMVVSREVSTYRNLLQNDQLMISILGGGMTLGVKGRARLIADPIADLPFPMAMFEISVTEVKDDSFLGRGEEGRLVRWEERRKAVSDHRVLQALEAGGGAAEARAPISGPLIVGDGQTSGQWVAGIGQ